MAEYIDLDLSLETRTLVLKDSLILENLISDICGLLLEIVETNDSFCFGNTSKALSFNQKIFLLIDIGALKNLDKTKFLKFMEIRNQFVHNINANNFAQCVSNIEGAEKYLLKTYKTVFESNTEEKLKYAYHLLVHDIRGSITSLLTVCRERMDKRNGD